MPPIAHHEGTEGEQLYSSFITLTSPLDRVGWLTPNAGYLTPSNDPVHAVQEARWALGPVWKISLPSGFDPRTVQRPAPTKWPQFLKRNTIPYSYGEPTVF
jgi:hypothetical protein